MVGCLASFWRSELVSEVVAGRECRGWDNVRPGGCLVRCCRAAFGRGGGWGKTV